MPDFEIEDSLNCMVAGVDEAGRGPWAGPVVAGAVIIRDRNLGDELLKGLDDSKKISAKKRELLYVNCRSVNCGQGLPGSSDAGAGTEIPLLCF